MGEKNQAKVEERKAPDPKNLSKGMKRKLLISGLLAATAIAGSLVDINLSSCSLDLKKLKKKLDRTGMLMTAKLTHTEIDDVRKTLESLPKGLLQSDDMKPLIIDTGCSKTVSGFIDDFVPESLKDLDSPNQMEGIGGSLTATKEGKVRYEVINDSGEISVIETNAFYMPKLKCRLFSPQTYLAEFQDENMEVSFTYKKMKLKINKKETISVDYNEKTRLPILTAYENVIGTAQMLSLSRFITDGKNQNLTFMQKQLLKSHEKLNHLGFQQLKWIGRKGWLGLLGNKIRYSSIDILKFTIC